MRIEVVGYDDTPLATTHRSSGTGGEGGDGERKVGGRSALHVQSLSYWAPANIGPYSQAITVRRLSLLLNRQQRTSGIKDFRIGARLAWHDKG